MKYLYIVTLFVLITTTGFTQTPTPTPTPDGKLIVCKSCPGQEYLTISDALDAAVAGDTIEVKWEDKYLSIYCSFEF